MKHILNKSTYFLFAIIAPIVYLLTCKLGGVGVKGFLLSTGFIELFIWFIFLMDYNWLPKLFKKENKND